MSEKYKKMEKPVEVERGDLVDELSNEDIVADKVAWDHKDDSNDRIVIKVDGPLSDDERAALVKQWRRDLEDTRYGGYRGPTLAHPEEAEIVEYIGSFQSVAEQLIPELCELGEDRYDRIYTRLTSRFMACGKFAGPRSMLKGVWVDELSDIRSRARVEVIEQDEHIPGSTDEDPPSDEPTTLDEILGSIECEHLRAIEKYSSDFDDKNTPNDWAAYISSYALTASAYTSFNEARYVQNLTKAAGLCVSALKAYNRVGLVPRHYDEQPNTNIHIGFGEDVSEDRANSFLVFLQDSLDKAGLKNYILQKREEEK